MTTARQIIKRALLQVGALVKNENPSADEANDGLESLNMLLQSWNNDSLSTYTRVLESFPLTSAASYTIGTGGDFNTIRPLSIDTAYVRLGTIDYQLSIIDDETFNSITYKNLTGIPQFINYTNSYPLGVIRIYSLGSASYTLYLSSEKPVASIATLDTVLSLPDGWERALVYNLALDLAAEYNQRLDPYIIKVAAESLGSIKTKVAQVRGMDAFPQGLAVKNIYSGYRN